MLTQSRKWPPARNDDATRSGSRLHHVDGPKRGSRRLRGVERRASGLQRLQELHLQEAFAGVVLEQLGVADVVCEDLDGLVTRDFAHLEH